MIEIYWLTRIAAIYQVAVFVSIFTGFAILAMAMFYFFDFCEDFDIEKKKYLKVMKTLAVTCSITLVTVIFLPSKKDMLFIFGVGTVYDIVKDDPVAKQIPHDAIKAIDEWLKEDKED